MSNMSWLTLNSFFVLFSLISCQVTYRDVNTLSGPVRGYNSDKDNVFSFYGIPYATVPTGEDRFKAALPAPTWSDVLNATTRNIVCPQARSNSDDIHELIRSPQCLNINVFVPDVQETNLPVMAYIHGGGFQEGYGMLFSPVEMVSKGVIVVNFNYRVGLYGFLCLGTEFAPGNAGLKDLVEALRWLKGNIARFGGDPDNITVGGNSAGASIVDLLVISPMGNGLFEKAVSDSASGTFSASYDPIAAAKYFATMSGQGNFTDATIEELEAFYASITDDQLSINYGYYNSPFGVCVETYDGVDKFIDKTPLELLQNGQYESRPYMFTYTPYEGAMQILSYDVNAPIFENDFASVLPSWLPIETEEERQEIATRVKNFYFPTGEITHYGYIEFFSDIGFMYPKLVSARLHALLSSDIYLYQFVYNGSLNLMGMENSPIWVPGHVAQSLYYLEYDYTPIYANMTDDDYIMQDLLHDLYINFLRYGNATQALTTTWLPVTPQDLNCLEIDLPQQRLVQWPQQERMEFWDELFGFSTTNLAVSPALSLSLLVAAIVINGVFN